MFFEAKSTAQTAKKTLFIININYYFGIFRNSVICNVTLGTSCAKLLYVRAQFQNLTKKFSFLAWRRASENFNCCPCTKRAKKVFNKILGACASVPGRKDFFDFCKAIFFTWKTFLLSSELWALVYLRVECGIFF